MAKIKPEDARAVIDCAVALNSFGKTERGAELLMDLADQLIPQKVTMTASGGAPEPPVITNAPTATEVLAKQAPAAPTAPAPQAPAAPTAAASLSETPAAEAAPAMTPEELNKAMVVEFQRLGSREGIDKAMADLGVSSVTQLAVDQYQTLLDAVKAL